MLHEQLLFTVSQQVGSQQNEDNIILGIHDLRSKSRATNLLQFASIIFHIKTIKRAFNSTHGSHRYAKRGQWLNKTRQGQSNRDRDHDSGVSRPIATAVHIPALEFKTPASAQTL